MPEEVSEALKNNATGPAEASGDAGSVRQHNLRDQIAADQYLANKTAGSGRTLPVRFAKIVAPGGTG